MKIANLSVPSQRALIWTGMILAGIYGFALVFLLNFFPPPSPSLSAQDVLALYANSNLQFRVGVVVMIVAGGFWTPYSVVLALQMAREETGAPIWAILQLVASVMMSWLFGFPPVMWGIAAFTVERAPELTLMLHEASWLTFVTPDAWFPFTAVPVAVVAFSKKTNDPNSAFPRWIGWIALLTAITVEFGVAAQLFKSGPFAWNGLFPFYIPLVAFSLFLGATNLKMLQVIGRQ